MTWPGGRYLGWGEGGRYLGVPLPIGTWSGGRYLGHGGRYLGVPPVLTWPGDRYLGGGIGTLGYPSPWDLAGGRYLGQGGGTLGYPFLTRTWPEYPPTSCLWTDRHPTYAVGNTVLSVCLLRVFVYNLSG